MDFYAGKSRDLPRFFYRKVGEALQGPQAKRESVLGDTVQFVNALKPEGDWQKMKWSLSPQLREVLSEHERQALESALQAKGARRNERLTEVYPHCADEFSTDIAFLDATFGGARYGLINQQTRILTIGSCFATNIAKFLVSKSYNVERFSQAEDLNSPFSNAKLLSVCAAPKAQRDAYIAQWVKTIYTPLGTLDVPEEIRKEIERLEALHATMKASEFIIVTCGNVLDYFIPQCHDGFDLGPAVAPKFLSIGDHEEIKVRAYLTKKLKEEGATFRMGNYAETLEAMEALYRAIRTINPTAHVLFTLSPVPIDSAIGIHQTPAMGAVEMDCISKSQLRVALADRMQAWSDDKALHYFPSFEIVRWIGACMGGPIFGAEDAASRHVSQTILSGVYRYFLHKYGVE